MYNNAIMRIYISCVFLLLFFLAGCSCPPAEPAPPTGPGSPPVIEPETKYEMELAKKFCPIINLNSESETGENFEPDPVQIMIDLAVVRDLENPDFSEKATIDNLLNWSRSAYYIDVINLNPKTNSPLEYKAVYDSLKGNYRPTVYTRVIESDSTGRTIVQYWLFYYLNDWRNIHEGDWELVQLTFSGKTVKEILKSGEQPIYAAYSQHQSGQRMSWDAMNEKGLVKGTHPIVYVAQGSHANYFTPGQFWSGLDFDDTGLSWQTIQPEQIDTILLSETEESGMNWLKFKGHWGEYIGFSVSVLNLKFWQGGPYGPSWSEEGRKSKKWDSPDEWASNLPDYPEPFWKSFLKLPGDWSKLAIFSLFSPADLHVYDSKGRHIGINEKGELEKQIPNAIYITPEGTDYKTILIPDADVAEEYTMVAKGNDTGIMDIKAQVPDPTTKLRRIVEYIGVPISVNTTARAKIKPALPGIVRVPSPAEILGGTTRDTVTILEIDTEGDSAFEIETAPGTFEKQKVTRSMVEAQIDIKPDTFNLSSEALDKAITCYIELPAEFDPKDIDVSTIILLGSINALETPVDITDHEQNGVPDLMVKFDRQVIIDYLLKTNQVEGKVGFTVTGIVNSQLFKGVDIITVTEGITKLTNE